MLQIYSQSIYIISIKKTLSHYSKRALTPYVAQLPRQKQSHERLSGHISVVLVLGDHLVLALRLHAAVK